jgi:hypothetical protein
MSAVELNKVSTPFTKATPAKVDQTVSSSISGMKETDHKTKRMWNIGMILVYIIQAGFRVPVKLLVSLIINKNMAFI